MRTEVTPQRLSTVPGRPAVVTIRVTNTRSIISGHRIRVLGIDPRWAVLDQDALSLFPGDSGVAVLTVNLPAGIPAGGRTVGIEVTELTEPATTTHAEVEITVPAEPGVTLSIDPPSTVGGHRAVLSVLVTNTGNSHLDVDLTGRDDTGDVQFRFDPPAPALAPGEQCLGTARLDARRPWFGNPKLRQFTIEAGPPSAPVIAFGAWAQKPRLSRGGVALVGLLAVATVFALVVAVSLSRVVTTSTTDRNLALQVAQASQRAGSAAGAGTAVLNGRVAQLTSGQPVDGVTVELFSAADVTTALVSTSTGAGGGYHFSTLAAGGYKLRFSGAGFGQLWYPQSLTPDGATVVTAEAGKTIGGLDVRLGGLPGSIAGKVVGGDPTGATLTLEVAAAPSALPSPASPVIVATQVLDAAGSFTFANVPSPGTYVLSLAGAGLAPSVQPVDLAGGQARSGLTIDLRHGDGSVAGTVTGPSGPLGGATVSATSGTATVSTLSSTVAGNVGNFSLTSLVTPSDLVLTVTAPGYGSQTLSLSLGTAQRLTGVAVNLTVGVGSIAGTVHTVDGAPAGGVTVTATDGKTTHTTVSLSKGAVGTYAFADLTIPDTYTLTFARADLTAQTRAVALPAGGPDTLTGIDTTMVASTAAISGKVVDDVGKPVPQVAVALISGSASYSVTSAAVPVAGAYAINGVAPGTYTISFTRPGGVPTSQIVALAPGQRLAFDVRLTAAASVGGLVVTSDGTPVPGVEVSISTTAGYPTTVVATTTTDAKGAFRFAQVDAPQDYVVAFAYPRGAPAQETVTIHVDAGTPTSVCGPQPSSGATACPPVQVATS